MCYLLSRHTYLRRPCVSVFILIASVASGDAQGAQGVGGLNVVFALPLYARACAYS